MCSRAYGLAAGRVLAAALVIFGLEPDPTATKLRRGNEPHSRLIAASSVCEQSSWIDSGQPPNAHRAIIAATARALTTISWPISIVGPHLWYFPMLVTTTSLMCHRHGARSPNWLASRSVKALVPAQASDERVVPRDPQTACRSAA